MHSSLREWEILIKLHRDFDSLDRVELSGLRRRQEVLLKDFEVLVVRIEQDQQPALLVDGLLVEANENEIPFY